MINVLKTLIIIAGLAAFALPVQAYEKGDWIFRAGVGVVDPESTSFSDSDLDLALKIDSGTSLTLTGAYFLSPKVSFEVLAAWPFEHDINLASVVAPSVPVKIGSVKHLPPTFSFQYHFMPEATFRPYVGLGVNYTTFSSEKLDQNVFPGASLSVDDSWGVAAQLAADIRLSDQWLLNVDLRYISIESDATISDGNNIPLVLPLDINPVVYSINIGYTF